MPLRAAVLYAYPRGFDVDNIPATPLTGRPRPHTRTRDELIPIDLMHNPGQADFDSDGVGDACEAETAPPKFKDQCKDGGRVRFDLPRAHVRCGAGRKHVLK